MVDDVEVELAILYAVLKTSVEVVLLLAVKFLATLERQGELAGEKATQGGEALSAVDDNESALLVLGDVEDRQRDPHQDRFDEAALLLLVPDEVPLEVRIEDEASVHDSANDILRSSPFIPDGELVERILLPPARPRRLVAFNLLVDAELDRFGHSGCTVPAGISRV